MIELHNSYYDFKVGLKITNRVITTLILTTEKITLEKYVLI